MNEVKKKGLSPLAWVGIGCGALVVLGLVAITAGGLFIGKKVKDFEKRPVEMTAKTIALASPELEYVSSDEEAKTVVFRNIKTGEEMTVDFEDIKDGKVRFDTGEGEQEVTFETSGEGGEVKITSSDGKQATLGGGGGRERIPNWVPVYPGAGVEVGFTASGDQGTMGIFELTGWESGQEVLDYYAKELEDQGYEVQRSTMSFGGNEQLMLTSTSADRKRTVSAQWLQAEGQSKVTVQYNEGG